ncbi:tripartite tricarboxylate transporter substrate binding protein [Roseomonas sp. HJA6]|uniref:Tripartite tricarboxylate transporter substrate binding protein n=1 Tax=Roseomonas alba TaxID=2846776 RepID=A0ABS7ADY8_9PROT|nr:tripartite tricarboxylate transporter substrate binding protein [Neoroseomonas alba]MBW6399947.1 tripartite tricarboxylate transporter substrate binding protein [Neoroseomonas alba]
MQQLSRRALFGAVPGVLAASAAQAQAQWPDRPVRIVVPYTPGAFNDSLGRLIGDRMPALLGQPGVVENRSGAGGSVGCSAVAQAPPDGYTILVCNTANMAFNPFIYPNLGYDPVRDFAPLGICARLANVLVVNPDVLPVANVAELLAYLRARPGQVNYASSGAGSSPHLAMELLKARTGVNVTHVPYRGSAPATADLLGGSIGLMFDNVPNALPHIQAGKVRALAVTGSERDATMPDVPTFQQAGVDRYEMYVWFGFAAPVRTPEPIRARLTAMLRRSIADQEVAERIRRLGADPWFQDPAQMAAVLRSDLDTWGPVIRAAGIQQG